MSTKNDRLEYRGVVVPVMKYLRTLSNGKFINIHGSVYSERGTPDIVGCIDGQMVVMECKRRSGIKADPIQEWRMQEWRYAGAIAGVISSVKDAQELIHTKKDG